MENRELDVTIEQLESLIDKNVIIVGDSILELVELQRKVATYLGMEMSEDAEGANVSIVSLMDSKELALKAFESREQGNKNTIIVHGKTRAYNVLSELTGRPEKYYEGLTDIILMIDEGKEVKLFKNR